MNLVVARKSDCYKAYTDLRLLVGVKIIEALQTVLDANWFCRRTELLSSHKMGKHIYTFSFVGSFGCG